MLENFYLDVLDYLLRNHAVLPSAKDLDFSSGKVGFGILTSEVNLKWNFVSYFARKMVAAGLFGHP